MKYVADRGYTDLKLNRHVEKGAVLEEEYKKENIELTEERKDYLVNERKLYIGVEEIPEGKVGDITPIDKVPEGAAVVDRVDIVEDNNEEEKQEDELVVESDKKEEEKTNVKSNAKTNMKNTKKSEEK